jgi:uncharacterized protein YdaU (DUF1376 family)
MHGTHWYAFYPGDYGRDTAHLSLVEDGAYRRLLDYCYSTGKPIPTCVEQVFRICRAFVPEEQAAVQSVLRQFFLEQPDGWHNPRAESELCKSRGIRAKRITAGKISASKRAAHVATSVGAPVEHVLTQPQPQPQPQKEENITSKPSVFDLELREIVLAVWDYYIATIGKNPKLYTLTDNRKRMGVARVRDLWPRAAEPKRESVIELMKLCVDRLASSPFHKGQNEQGKKYLDWDILFRSTEQMEKWLSDERTRQ